MTTETFSDYVAQQDARNTIQTNVTKYCLMLCDALADNFKSRNNGKLDGYKFYLESNGRKYHKLIMETGGGNRSVHAFINKKTGEVYKPASWNKAAQHVRYDLRIIRSRMDCYARADWAGGYLYMR